MTRFGAFSRALFITAIYVGVCALSTVPMPFGTSGHKICFLDSVCTFSNAPTGTWTLPVTNGGTGANNASSARTNLGADNAANLTSGTLALGIFPVLTNNSVYANISGSVTNPSITTVTALLDNVLGSAQGDIAYRAFSSWVALPPGTSGQALQTQGGSANPQWASIKGPLMANSSATQAANSTMYYPCNGSSAGGSATETDVSSPMPYSGTMATLYVAASSTPGVGQTYTATVRKTGADQALACQISGLGVQCNDTTLAHAVAFNAGDKCSIKVVSSTTAAATKISNGEEYDTP